MWIGRTSQPSGRAVKSTIGLPLSIDLPGL